MARWGTRRAREKQSDHLGEIGRNPLLLDSTRISERVPDSQTLPTIPLPDIELTPLKTSTPTSRIASPALIKGRVNEILRLR